METKEFVSRAESLLQRLDEIEKSPSPDCFVGYDVYPEYADLYRDVVHLIYAYDERLPLLDEIKELYNAPKLFAHPMVSDDWPMHIEKLRSLTLYFIQYLKDFG